MYTRSAPLRVSPVNSYLAHKQHLLPNSRLTDVVQVTRNIVALHATDVTAPYFSLWARVPNFERLALEEALYERRRLTRTLCMRVTLHVVPSDEIPFFIHAFQTCIERRDPVAYRGENLLAQAGLCNPQEAERLQSELHRRILGLLVQKGASTAQEISQALPELKVKIRHGVGKPYEGKFSVGSRLVPRMCTSGLLVRTRLRGTWRSNLYEYAPLAEWLPDVGLESVTPHEARVWLLRRYLSAFGPAMLEDVQWWTGFTKTETKKTLAALEPVLVKVAIEGLSDDFFMLADDARRLDDFTPPDVPCVLFLPCLDPYVMGYRDRRRFLAPEQRTKIFDRAGNAVPTVWVNGRVAGMWGQRKGGSVIYRLFEPVDDKEQALLSQEAQRLEGFLGDEYLPPRFHTPFTHTLGRQT
jgi:hypothetical protein